jgi:replicative DNA helicase
MIEDITDTMVSAPEAEVALLSCVIDNPEAYAPKMWQAEIDASYFYIPAHSELFSLLSDRIRDDKPVDPSSLRDAIRKIRPEHLRVGSVVDVVNAEKSEEGWDGYVESLREARAQRLLQAATPTGGHPTADEGLERVREALQAAQDVISGASSGTNAVGCMKVFAESLEEVQSGGIPGMATGIPQFDANTGGMRSGQLWVIGAPTSGGKSILMLQIATAAIQDGKKVAIFSLEMDTREIVNRIVSCGYGVPMSQLSGTENLTQGSLNTIKRAASELTSLNYHIFDQSGMTMDHISGQCCKLRDTEGLDLIVIDYIQQVSAPYARGQSREQEVANISRGCKQLAKRIGCPVLTATQLNADGASRESRAIENDADNVLIISHKMGSDNEVESNIQFWKCRNGQRGLNFSCAMDGLHQKFDIKF